MKKNDKRNLIIGVIVFAVVVVAIVIAIIMNKDGKNTDDKFIVGFDASFPPYGYMENGEYVGFDLDLAEEVCKRNGWEFVKQPIAWDSKDMELNDENIDCIWNGFTMSDERLDKYEWSEPYVDNSQVVIVKKDSGIEKLSDLSGKKVAVQSSSSAQTALESDENKELKDSFEQFLPVADYDTAFLELKSGNVDAVAMDIGVARTKIADYGDEYVMLDEILAKEKYAIGFKLGNEKLRDQVQKTLDDMVEDGTFMEIAKKWKLEDEVCLGK